MKIDRVEISVGWLLALTLIVLVLSSFGSARATVWTFSNCSNSGVNATCTTPNGLIARGVSNTGSGGALTKAGAVLYAGGVGVSAAGEPTSSPNHAIDNSGFVDALYLNFGQVVDLDSITIGWKQTDADISLFRYTGSGDPWGNDLLGETYASLSSSDWAFVGNYADLAVDVARAVNAGEGASQYWLISAYTSAAGAGCNAAQGASCGGGNDYFKLEALATSAPPLCGPGTGIACASTVPEPGSLALLGVALASGLALRIRRRR